jgi:hypothetical protein
VGAARNEAFLCGPSPLASKSFRDAGAFWVTQKIIVRVPPEVLGQAVCGSDAAAERTPAGQVIQDNVDLFGLRVPLHEFC